MRISLFTTCKPFEGQTAVFQEAALESWRRAFEEPEILVIGDEPGVAACCQSLGLSQEKDLPCNEWGTPRLDQLFSLAEKRTTGELLCYLNADIVLGPGVRESLERVAESLPRFLAIGRRINVSPDAIRLPLPSSAELCEIGASGEPEPLHGGVDIFAYPRGFWSSIPPYLLGRGRWDSGLILEARRKAAPVVDITPSITALHPKHGYTRHPEDTEGLRREELAHNAAILGGAECIYSAVNSTHVLRNDTLKRFLPRHPLQLLRRLATASAIVPALRPLSPLVRWLGPRLRSIQPSTPDADLPWIMD